MTKNLTSLAERLARIDFPHTRNGQEWDRESKTFQRLLQHAERLQSLGLTQDEISFMLRDLYWDAFSEFHFKDVSLGKAGAFNVSRTRPTDKPSYQTPLIRRRQSTVPAQVA